MRKTLYSVQVLRGVAALFVVVLHAYVHLQVRGLIKIPSLVESGRAGVDIFFVISGFIMVYISSGKFGAAGAAKDFFIKRFIRVVPIYWFYTLIMAALLFAAPQLFSEGKSFDYANLVASLLFIPWVDSIGYIKPVLQVGWTLDYEMYFYVIFTALLLFSSRYFIVSLAVILLTGFFVGLIVDSVPPVFSVMTSPLLLEFFMGCLIGYMFTRYEIITPAYVGILMLIAGFSMLVFTGIFDVSDVPRTIKWGIPSTIILAGAILLECGAGIDFHHLLTKLGDSSYSLYLSHIFTINAVGKIWRTFFGETYDAFIVVSVLSAIIVAYLAYLIIEKPLIGYLNKKYNERKKLINAINISATV